jgi:hypothetical protein
MDPRLARPLWRGRTNVDALTIACIEHAEALGHHAFEVTQGSYQAGAGDPNSAGTHDLGGVVDLRWCGHNTCVLHLRQAGMAAWHRTPDQGPWAHHIHAVVLGHPLVSAAARAQRIDYFAGRNGLANHAADDGPRLNPIPLPIWPWPPEEDMPLSPEDIKALLDTEVDEGVTVRRALRRAGRTDAEIKALVAAAVKEALAAGVAVAVSVSATATQES